MPQSIMILSVSPIGNTAHHQCCNVTVPEAWTLHHQSCWVLFLFPTIHHLIVHEHWSSRESDGSSMMFGWQITFTIGQSTEHQFRASGNHKWIRRRPGVGGIRRRINRQIGLRRAPRRKRCRINPNCGYAVVAPGMWKIWVVDLSVVRREWLIVCIQLLVFISRYHFRL